MSTWVLLRGLTRDSRHWGSFPGVFKAYVPDAQVVTLELPGNGARYRERSPVRVDEMMAACRQDLAGRGVAPPFYLLAMSLGAMVAVEWCVRHAVEIRGCVLINTSLRPFSPFYQRLRPGSYADLLALAWMGGDAAMQERRILRLTSRKLSEPTSPLQDWISYRESCPVTRSNGLRQLVAAAAYRAPGHRPSPPMLTLAGAGDRLVNPECSIRLASRWQTALAVHPDAGHDLPLDDALWVAERVRDWLATCA